jgi:dihydrofolate reductase
MRKLILKMSISVDGFVGGPNGEIEWIFATFDSGATRWTVDLISHADVHIMGSRTFYDMSAHWPTSTEPFAAPMNEIPKVVFSRKGLATRDRASLTTTALQDATRVKVAEGIVPAATPSAHASTWAEAAVARGDLAEEIRRLRQQPGNYMLAHGGAGFAQSLVQLDLVDEYWLLTHPVALGAGLPLFSLLRRPRQLRLVSSTAFEGGACANVYRRA